MLCQNVNCEDYSRIQCKFKVLGLDKTGCWEIQCEQKNFRFSISPEKSNIFTDIVCTNELAVVCLNQIFPFKNYLPSEVVKMVLYILNRVEEKNER